VKGILSEATKRFSHTRVNSSIHLAPATKEINPEYLIVLSNTYPTEGKKRLQEYARLSGLWVIITVGSVTKGAFLCSSFISSHH
jgi:ribosomal protein L30E